MRKLKYQIEINKYNPDFSLFIERNRIAFRWTFKNIADERNFLPRYVLIPEMERNTFLGWGLSFFANENQAKNRILEIAKNRKNILKKLGTHIAKGFLEVRDGISDESSENGHFTHFEYEEVALYSKFKIETTIDV